MGDHQSESLQPNGFSIEDRLFPLSSPSLSPSSPLSNADPFSISDDCWQRGEKRTREIICQIQPSLVSERRRKAVIDYVQRLIRYHLGSEVFPFGSVPLKTYLPDGDIDLTAICIQNVEDALANDVRAVLEGEEQNEAAEFEVTDVQYIHAEVKLVKCLVQNIVVDISFNQLGGLCTLCFLEQVDRLIGKDHLFKRSIILIKAWCYYESRILGAHHGLISTYALETLVLYIFHLFHSSLDGPLAVLYKFLDYFSKFDWDNYCISLNGPVCISSLPEIVVETPDNGGDALLLSKGFIKNCVDMFSVPLRGLEINSRAFPQKHFNIVDPLKENNNLGRSVSKGNFYRIRSAFAYGARKLNRILVLPVESVADELNKFFANTLFRDGRGQRPDVKDHVPTFGAYGSVPASSMPGIEKFTEEKTVLASPSVDSSGTERESRVDAQGLLCKGISEIAISLGLGRKPGTGISNEAQNCTARLGSSLTLLEIDGFANGNAPSEYRLAGDAENLTSSRTERPRISIQTPESTLCNESSISPLGRARHVPRHYFSNSFTEKGKIENGNSDQSKPTSSGVVENNVSSRLPGPPDEVSGPVLRQDCEETELATDDTTYSLKNHERAASVGTTYGSSSIDCPLEDLYLGYREGDLASTAGSPGPLNSLSDLSGDNDSHLKDLQYARWCHDYAFSGSVLPIPPSPSQFRNKHAFNTFHQSMQLQRNVFSPMHVNGVVSGPQFYSTNPPIMAGSAYGAEELPKPRGTGTYFPNTNYRSYRDRSVPGRGRNLSPAVHGQFRRPPRENGWAVTPPEATLFEKGSHEPLQAQFSVLPGRGKPPGPLEFFQGGRPVAGGFPHANGFGLPPEKLEFGSLRHLPVAPSPEGSKQPVSSTPLTQGSTSSLPAPALQRPRPVSGVNPEGIAIQSYQLKDEADFPPLSI